MSCTITAAEFKAYFDRGQFQYGDSDPYIYPEVRDKDIDSAIAEAEAVFNCGLFPDESTCKQALYYLTAHFLQKDLDAVESGGQASYNQTSRSADGISESLSIPEWMNEGEFAFYATTYWGQKYLMLVKPYLDGAVFSVPGGTQP
jgi:hypothetical protein